MEHAGQRPPLTPGTAWLGPTPLEQPGAPGTAKHKRVPSQELESAIDVLYENERGGFLCGIGLFSSRALGNLDPPAWTNAVHRPSPTNIRTAQVPDPSWEWAWPEWRINHDVGTDDAGWQYSFMFARKFKWHGPKWYNSFVRRRAWIRKRVKKGSGALKNDAQLLNPEYFTIQPASEVRRSSSRASSSHLGSRASVSVLSAAETGGDDEEKPDIENVEDLLRVLRRARIDREKIEAVDNFLQHGEDDLVHLQDEMHEIMSLFVFQASRRILLTDLTRVYDEAVKTRDEQGGGGGGGSGGSKLQEKVDNLAAAVQHADEECRRLEYWSDVRAMVEGGESKGGADHQQGWDESKWKGVDQSGPAQPAEPRHEDK